MIKNVAITGVHVDVDAKLRKYITKKIGQLDRYISRKHRDSILVEVILKEQKSSSNDKYVCEAIIHLPHESVTVKEATVNMFAAVDIVEAKLRNQLKKYKDLHGGPRLHRRLLSKLRRSVPA